MPNITCGAIRGAAIADAEGKLLKSATANNISSGQTFTVMVRIYIDAHATSNDRVLHFDDGTYYIRLFVRQTAGDMRWEIRDVNNTSAVAITALASYSTDTWYTLVLTIDTATNAMSSYVAGSAPTTVATGSPGSGTYPARTGNQNFIILDSGEFDIAVAEMAIWDVILNSTQINDLVSNAADQVGAPISHKLITKTTGAPLVSDDSITERTGNTSICDDLDVAGATGAFTYITYGTLNTSYASEDETFDGSYGGDATVLGPVTIGSVTVGSGVAPTITTGADHGLSVGDYLRFVGGSATVTVGGDTVEWNTQVFKVASTPTSTTFTITDSDDNAVTISAGATADHIESFKGGESNRKGKRVSMTIGVSSDATEDASKRPTVTAVSKGFTSAGVPTTFTRTMKLAFVSASGNGDGTSTILADLIEDPSRSEDGHYVYGEDVDVEMDIPAAWLTSSGANSAAVTAAAVTNSSTLAYPQSGVHSLTRPRQAFTGSFNMDVVADNPMGVALVQSMLVDSGAVLRSTKDHTLTLVNRQSNNYGPSALVPAYRASHSVSGASVGAATCHVRVYPRIGSSYYDTALRVSRPNTNDVSFYLDLGNTESALLGKCYVDSRTSIDLNSGHGSVAGTLQFGEYVHDIANSIFAYVSETANLGTGATSLKLNDIYAPIYSFTIANTQTVDGGIKSGDVIMAGNSFRFQTRGPNGVIEGLTAPGDNPVITSVAHGLIAGDLITLRDTRTSGDNPISNGGSYEVIAPVAADTFAIRQADATTVNVTSVDTASGATLGYWEDDEADQTAWSGRVIAVSGSTVYAEIWSSGLPQAGDRWLAFDRTLAPPKHLDAGVGSVESDATQWGGGNLTAYGQVNTGAGAAIATVAGSGDPSVNILAGLTGGETLTGATSGAVRVVAGTPNVTKLGDDSTAEATASGNPSLPARTIRGAIKAVQTFRGDSKADRGTALLNPGFHVNGGESNVALATDDAEFTITPASGVTKAQAIICRASQTSDGFNTAGNGARGLGIDWKFYNGVTFRYFSQGDDLLKEDSTSGEFFFNNCDLIANAGQSVNWSNPIGTDGKGARFYNSYFDAWFRIHLDWSVNSNQAGADPEISFYFGCRVENVGGDVFRNCTYVDNCTVLGTGAEGTSVHSDSWQIFQNTRRTMDNVMGRNISIRRHVRGQPIVFFGANAYPMSAFYFTNITHDDNQDPSLSNAGQILVGSLDTLCITNCHMGDDGPSFTGDMGYRPHTNIFVRNNIFKNWGITNGLKVRGLVKNCSFQTPIASNIDDGTNKSFTLASEFSDILNPTHVDDIDYFRPDSDFDIANIVPHTANSLLSTITAYNQRGVVSEAGDPVGPLPVAADSGAFDYVSASIEGGAGNQVLRLTLDKYARVCSLSISIGVNGAQRTLIFRMVNSDESPLVEPTVTGNPTVQFFTSRARLVWDIPLNLGSPILDTDSIDDFTIDGLSDALFENRDTAIGSKTFSESPGMGEIQVTNNSTASGEPEPPTESVSRHRHPRLALGRSA